MTETRFFLDTDGNVLPDEKGAVALVIMEYVKDELINERWIDLSSEPKREEKAEGGMINSNALYLLDTGPRPHASWIWNGRKTLFIKARRFYMENHSIYLLGHHDVYGILTVTKVEKWPWERVFKELSDKHLVLESEALEWWGRRDFLYVYHFEFKRFDPSVPFDKYDWKLPQGVQNFVTVPFADKLPSLEPIKKAEGIRIEFLGSGPESKHEVRDKEGKIRHNSSTLIDSKILINLTPDQESWFQQNFKTLGACILSHAHEDVLGDWVKNKDYVDKFPPLFITEKLIQAFKTLRNIDVIETFTNVIQVKEGALFDCMGRKLRLIEVEHADNTPTYAVEINDEIIHSEDIYVFKDNSVLDNKKLWIGDGSLFDCDILTHHVSMKKQIALAAEHHVERLIFTQIGFNGGMTHQELHDACHKYADENYPKFRHISLAYEGKTETVKSDESLLKTAYIDPAKPRYRIFELSELESMKGFHPPLLFQKKYDGFQSQIHTEGGKGVCTGKICSGRGKDKTHQFKSIIVQALGALAENSVVDAESLMYEGSQPLHRSMIIGYADSSDYDEAQEKKCIFEIYDVLFWNGEDVRKLPLEERLKILNKIKTTANIKVMGGEDNRVVSTYSQMEPAKKHCFGLKGSEGAMIKQLQAPYESPQNSSWAKIKKTYELDVLVTDKKTQKTGTYNYYVSAGPLEEKCIPVFKEKAPDDLREWKGKNYLFLGGTFNTSVEANIGDIIRIDTIEVNKREIENTGCFTYGIFHPRVLENINDIKSVPDQLSVLDRIARFALPVEKASKDTLDTEYEAIAEEGTRLPNRFYKFNTSKSLKFVLHEHKPGKKEEPVPAGIKPEVPSHGETGFKSKPKIKPTSDITVLPDGSAFFTAEIETKGEFILKFRDHLDLRMEIREEGVIWHGYTPHPPQDPTVWDVLQQRFRDHRQIQCAAKSPCTHERCMEWFKLGREDWTELPAGEPGASTIRTGLLKIRDSGTYELGVQRNNMHEYFFKGNTLKGKVVFRRLTIGGALNWYMTLPEDQIPLKPWEHEDSGDWRIKGAEAPELEKALGKPVHPDTGFIPERMIRLMSDELNEMFDRLKKGKATKREILAESDILFNEYSERIAESARLRLSKKLKRIVKSLPSELQARLDRMATDYHSDFKKILDGWESKH